jgi:lipopolysaccharide/colanic/teichoic acid biosynthesis glycosyltransferase
MDEEKAIQIITAHQHIGYQFFERTLEIIIALVVLIVCSPLLLVAIIGRFIEDGSPIFYTQTRAGKDNTIFNVYKLRSMKKDAEKNGVQWADKRDARTTAFGRLLRKTHIDELPQMWNVLRGDIALIGPRPERPEIIAELEKTIPYYSLRHSVKPGFTGWAQIKFRYARTVLDSQEKFEYDLYYLLNKNPLLDFGILVKTIQIIFTH